MPRFLAIYIADLPAGVPVGQRMSQETQMQGIMAWGAWMQEYEAQIIDVGGPLGRTKSVSRTGISDVSNSLTGYVIVEAQSHQAAAAMFRDHPHFTIFPGKCVEVMDCPPIPGTEGAAH